MFFKKASSSVNLTVTSKVNPHYIEKHIVIYLRVELTLFITFSLMFYNEAKRVLQKIYITL